VPDLLGDGGFHLGANQHLHLLCADGYRTRLSLLGNGRIVPRRVTRHDRGAASIAIAMQAAPCAW
jgi:hypothetical protein